MDFPSMVQRAGDKLIVRSVVSGNQLYADQQCNNNNINRSSLNKNNKKPQPETTTINHLTSMQEILAGNRVLEQELNRFAHEQFIQQQQKQSVSNLASGVVKQQQQQKQFKHQPHIQPQSQATNMSKQQHPVLELKEERLPQCKIKRNYSCNYCTYFTQNPRFHLTHLRDVHGEKIVINKCKLCLYASRHFQKLVRHMKMVHGCTDGITVGHGQARGKRGMTREMRKRKLEQSVGLNDGETNDMIEISTASSVSGVNDMTTLEQFKRELELQEQKLQREKQAFNKQQQDQKIQQQQMTVEAVLAAAYARQRSDQEQLDMADLSSAALYQRVQSPATNLVASKNVHATSSNSGSISPAEADTPTYNNSNNNIMALGEERPHTRLLKCSVCDFTTLYRTELQTHELDEHNKTKFFRCEKCSYVTHIKARYSKHVKYHSMPMIKCVTCDFRTPYKWNLDRHMKNHGGTGAFKCAACDFTADIKQSLTVHEMNHHVPPVGHAAGMALMGRRRVNKVGATDISDDFLSDSADLDDQFHNNNIEDFDDELALPEPSGSYVKKFKYDAEEPTDLSQKCGSSDCSSVHNLIESTTKHIIDFLSSSQSGSNLKKKLAPSSLGDIASMFFTENQIGEMSQLFQNQQHNPQLSPTQTIVSTSSQISRTLFQNKKTVAPGSFFEKLKSSALATGGTNDNLICPCGHIAKCLSESIIHRKTCKLNSIAEDDIEEEQDDLDGRLEIDFTEDDDKQSHSALNLSISGSTRCQHCRHRCKTSTDLINHLKICQEAGRFGDSYNSLSGDGAERRSVVNTDAIHEMQHPMENRVFIWNNLAREASVNTTEMTIISENGSETSKNANAATTEENRYYGVETAPGYGEVTKKMTPEEETANSSLKKVYKCPHCSFWASTASRFHVHIVGHLNKKPFECSLCSYRSNWRWDITKHIRLKTIRDPSHKNARVLMNDETGRRNYTKYNKYITLMKVTEEDGDPKLMKSGEMTPNQVASLAFFNDFSKNMSSSGDSSHIIGSHVNGFKEEISLEPVTQNQPTEEFLPLPLLANMMNVALSQQISKDETSLAALITPTVTISAIRRNQAPPVSKLCDDLIIDIKQEEGEQRTYYRCRKCSFRHFNRDAALAHVKIHYIDGNYPTPIVTATTKNNNNNSGDQKMSSPLHVSINSNQYMSKMLAALCLPQNKDNIHRNIIMNRNHNNSKSNIDSMLSVGLQKTIQENNTFTKNSIGGGEMISSILEHGEQKATQNEASATEDYTIKTQNTITNGDADDGDGYGNVYDKQNKSLQNLLIAPLEQENQTFLLEEHVVNKDNDCVVTTNNNLVLGLREKTFTTSKINNSQNKSYNKVVPLGKQYSSKVNDSVDVGNGKHKVQQNQKQQLQPTANNIEKSTTFIQTLNGCVDHHNNCSGLVVNNTLLSNSSISSSSFLSPDSSGGGCGGINVNAASADVSTSSSSSLISYDRNPSSCSLSSFVSPIKSPIKYQNHANLIVVPTAISSIATATTNSTKNVIKSTSSNTSSKLISSINHIDKYQNNENNVNSAIQIQNTHIINNNNQYITTSNITTALIVNDCDQRRDPLPYRCGHCHQVSNWKHVIQRHCRLKHAADIRIETLERSSLIDINSKPIYRALGPNSALNNESTVNFDMSVKGLQHQPHKQQVSITMANTINQDNSNDKTNNNVNNNNNNELILQNNSQTSADDVAAANAANTTQDLQAAASAYLAAVSRQVTSSSSSSSKINADDLLQLQQNEQIEITRLSNKSYNNINNNNNDSKNNNITRNNSNLAHLLDNNHQPQALQQQTQQLNSKSKQQKCPMCPYISESKSQMNYHVSLHKPTQYECTLCTFVCAKKQHLSGHMRTMHQPQIQLNNSTNINSSISNINSGGNIIDINSALQHAVSAFSQQNQNTLAIDLSAIKKVFSAVQQQQQKLQKIDNSPKKLLTETALSITSGTSSLPPEYQYKLILHCPKCPIRFAQKHSDNLSASNDLHDHMQWHNSKNPLANYSCEYCDFRSLHDTLIQTHHYVHTQQYQDKFNELYKNCKDDWQYSAPRLQIKPILTNASINGSKNIPDFVWIVDKNSFRGVAVKEEIISPTHQNQKHEKFQNVVSSTPGVYDNSHSLLKKQLESGSSALTSEIYHTTEQEHFVLVAETEAGEETIENCSALSISASVVTSDVDAELASEAVLRQPNMAQLMERCQHCPFETRQSEEYKEHLQHHICVKQKSLAHVCEHCDYTDELETEIIDHTRLHFNVSDKLKSVAFFTSYDNLQLKIEPSTLKSIFKNQHEQNEQKSEAADEKTETDKLAVDIKKEIQNSERINNNSSREQTPEHNNNNEENSINQNTHKYANNDDIQITSKTPKIIDKKHNIGERLRSRAGRVVAFPDACQSHQQQEKSQKILVNAKTGQVISRN